MKPNNIENLEKILPPRKEMIVPDDAEDVNLDRLDPDDYRRGRERYHQVSNG
jgi:hypothetical protein